jgi:hypothetical protein
MRFRRFVPAALVLAAWAAMAAGDVPAPKAPPTGVPKSFAVPVNRAPRLPRFLSFRSIATQVDTQVIANLLAATPSRPNEIAVSATAGEIARCESRTCQVPMNVRVEGAQGMVTLTFAVASPKGELSEVHHAECNSGDCIVSLILERGENTISVGVLDAFAQMTGYTTMKVNAAKSVADRGKTEWF